MAVVAVRDEVDVVAGSGVFDCVEGLLDHEVAALGVCWFLQVGRPRLVVDHLHDRVGVVV